MNKKYYSDKQEKLIANYLGWFQVVGSGSRPMLTGDISSTNWLGECKTHITSGNNILFDSKVWDKIVSEASAKFRQPAYFVDDGSQDTDKTWVMFMDTYLSSRFEVVEYPYKINKTITFKHSDLKARTPYLAVYKLHLGNYDVMLTTLETFYHIM